MKKLLFITGLISCSMACLGQAKITGRIKDQQEYLPFVSVILRQDSAVSNATTTDSLGNFVFENVAPGHYQLFASMVGYEPHVSSVVEIKSGIRNLGEIVLQESAQTLQEISVTSQKQWAEQRTDRMVINLAGSITGTGNTVLEVLQKSPGVMVNKQNGTIAVNGKAGVRIMINDKILQIPPDAAMQMLEGMNSSNVEKIEIILNPSAAYDADGAGGIIHIVTKESELLGTNGTITLTAGAKWAETFGGALNVNHRTKKAAYFLDYSFLRTHNLHKMNVERKVYLEDNLQTVSDSSHRENITDQQNLSAGAEFQLSPNTSLKVLITGYKRNWRLDAETFSRIVTPDSIATMSMNVVESNVWQSGTGSIGLQQKLNGKSRLDVSFDYLYYHNNNPSDYYGNTSEFEDIGLSKKTPIHIFVGKADYRFVKSPSFSFDAGIKAVTSNLTNDVMVKRLQESEWVVDEMFTSYSSLDEQITAGYFTTQWKPSTAWIVNAGLRYEYTHTSITSQTGENLVERKYGYFFPSLSLTRNFSERSELYFAYTRRITRPTYNDIAPFVFFWGPGSFSAGNTALFPAFSEGITASYRLSPWTVSLQYTHTQKEIAGLQPEVDEENLIYRSQNLKYLSTLALSTSYAVSITSWWEAQASVVARYQVAQTRDGNSFPLYGVSMNMMNALKLPKDFAIEISGTYQSKTLMGISQFFPMGSLNAGIQKKFGGGSTLKLSIDDILYTTNWRIKTLSPENNLDVDIRYDWHNQFIRLTYTWTLGNGKLRSVKVNSASDEERRRVN